jgi:serine/threonine protein kinase
MLAVEPSARNRELNKHCAGDPGLQEEVESLLSLAEKDLNTGNPFADKNIERIRRRFDAVLDEQTTAAEIPVSTDPFDPALGAGTQIGRYTIERVLGQGGMGVVYAAIQRTPARTVALKLIRPGSITSRLLRRFEIESEILGRLRHPGIAHIYDAGIASTPMGKQPFFAMEYIDGESLTEYADLNKLGTRQRLNLVAQIADAVEHAHRKGVIHRDLKPGNILVDESGQPKILDFGVARATDTDLRTATMQTDVGMLIGTLSYMSPEQASGDPDALDTRSDVYSLGVVAYELLAGQMPYDLRGVMIHEAVGIIREKEPSTISTIDRTLRGDVDTIVGKAMAKEPGRRYQSASEFGEDVRRYLSDQPISARPPSAIYQFRKFTRRNKAIVGGAALVLLTLVVGLVGTSYGLFEAQRQAALVEKRAEELQQVTDFQSQQISSIKVKQMGEGILASILERLSEADRIAIENSLVQVNFTDIAAESLRANIFEQSIQAIDENFADQPLVQAQLLQSLGGSIYRVGLDMLALMLYERAFEIRRTELGDADIYTKESAMAVSSGYQRQGRFEEAEQILRAVYEAYLHEFGEEHKETRRMMGHLAGYLSNRNQRDESLLLFERIYELHVEIEGPEATKTLLAMGNLAIQYGVIGQEEHAAEMLRQLIEIQQRLFGESYDSTLNSKTNLVMSLRALGDMAGAIALAQEILNTRRRTDGNDDIDTIQACHRLVVLLIELDRREEAHPLLQEIYEYDSRRDGDDHHRTMLSLTAVAYNLRMMGEFERAEPLYVDVYERSMRVLGEKHALTLQRMAGLVLTLVDTGSFEEAEPLALAYERLSCSEDGRGSEYAIKLVAQLYEKWHEAEPERGYDAKAQAWRAKLPEAKEDGD